MSRLLSVGTKITTPKNLLVRSGWKGEISRRMRPPLRVAVLECDTPLDKTRHKYGGYGGVFEALLKAGADHLGRPEDVSSKKGLEITKWNVVDEDKYPALEDVDAVLLTGSKHNAFEDHPWILRLVEYTKTVLGQDRVRIIGACFGHQIVGRALGAKVDRSEVGWEISCCAMDLTEKGKELFGRDQLQLYQLHRDIVYEYPPGVEPLGSSAKCAVQGMYQKGRLITVQGHPEFTKDIMMELFEVRHDMGILDDVIFGDAMSRVGHAHDGVVVSAAFLKFLLDD
ncbi:class I glutamine amidotransferase-like protein [Lineolata rhizophorae]|uniref:Class I glutamine amidotransferase-like protein n=1 Tax=Lineolata rhizophorae TaxID=578093 RepID=A0A6A6P556_9PEZI|nr:class I glutamine amidotransferase-like protein [Lineolata rhizophorae]